MVEQRKLTKGKAALLLVLSALIAVASALKLHGWEMYVGLAIAGAALLFAFLRWNRRQD